MTGILALFGSGEFTPAVEAVDKFLLGKTPNPKIAIIPTAAGKESDYRKWIDMGVVHYKKLGFAAQGFAIKDRKGTDSGVFAKELAAFNYFVFSGGDPGYLLDTLKGSLVWKTILRRHKAGATLIGSSAGAMAFGAKTFSKVYEFDQIGLVSPWEKGLGLTDFGVIPHYDFLMRVFSKEKLAKIKKVLPKNTKVIGIDEDTAYIRIGNRWQVLGGGQVHNPAKL